MKHFIIAILFILLAVNANAAIYVVSSDGTPVVSPSVTTLSQAATASSCVGKTIHVSSALSSSFSNISSSTRHSWPTDRTLVIDSGGSVGNTTIFRTNNKVVFNGGIFSGIGRVTGLKTARPEWFGNPGVDDTAIINKAILAVVDANGTLEITQNHNIAGRVVLNGTNIEIRGVSGSLGGSGFQCTTSGSGVTVGVSSSIFQNRLTNFAINGGGVATKLLELMNASETVIDHIALNDSPGVGLSLNGLIVGITQVTNMQTNGVSIPVSFLTGAGTTWFKYCNFFVSDKVFNFAAAGNNWDITVTDSWFETYNYAFNIDATAGSQIIYGLKIRDNYFQNTLGGEISKTSRIIRVYVPAGSSYTAKIVGLEWTGGIVYNTASAYFVETAYNGTFGSLHSFSAKIDDVTDLSPAGVTSWVHTDINNTGAKFTNINFGKNNYSSYNIPVQDNAYAINGTELLTANSATPSVASQASAYRTANTSPTTIINFTGGTSRNPIDIYVGDSYTTFAFVLGTSYLRGHGGTNYAATLNDLLHCTYDEVLPAWRCTVLPVGG